MKITFLGTGAAEGVPAAFCTCSFCTAVRAGGASEIRTRSQVVIDGDLSIDYPPDAFTHCLRFGVNAAQLKYLLVTHSHMDHFYAHDFILRGYKYATLGEDVLQIYGNEEVRAVYNECTRREMKEQVSPHLGFSVLHSYNEIKAGEYRILTLPAMHGTTEEALLYYVEKAGKGYLHLCDTGNLEDGAIEFLRAKNAKISLVTFDCTFLDAPLADGTRHMCIERNMQIKDKIIAADLVTGDARYVITHFSHNARPTRERLAEIERRYNVIAAYDGMALEI